ncbi:MAG: chloramphenicol acetyltransferase [Ferruginibacter sp.]
MKQKINIDEWPRKDHFNFFRQFDEPFFGICVQVDCTIGYETAKRKGMSFFLFYLYQALTAANKTVTFRYRIIGEDIFQYDVVHASPTINRPDGTFGFAYLDHKENIEEFIKQAQVEIDKVQGSKGLIPAVSGENVIHFSSIPWLNFSSLSHARSYSFKDSSPKISFGKMTELDGKRTMPVSIHAHHGLMDGYHVGQFVDTFQELMNS